MNATDKRIEELYQERNKAVITYARRVYREQQYLTTNNAMMNGFTNEKEQYAAKQICILLVDLFGKKTFSDL